MSRSSGVRAGRAYVEISAKDRLTRSLERIKKRVEAFGSAVRSLGVRVGALGGLALGGLAAMGTAFSRQGDLLDKASIRTGVSVEALSELKVAAELSGAGMEQLEGGFRVMQRNILDASEGAGEAVQAFERLGLSIDEVSAMTPEAAFERVADALAAVEDPSIRAGAAMKLLGRGGTALLPMLEEGAEGIRRMREQARRLGLTMSTEDAKSAALLNDELGLLGSVLSRVQDAVGAALTPALVELARIGQRVAAVLKTWIDRNRGSVASFAKVAAVVTAVGGGLVALGVAAKVLAVAVGLLVPVLGAVVGILGILKVAVLALASPFVLAGAAAVAAGLALRESFAGVREVVAAAADHVANDALGPAIDWVAAKFGELRAVAASAFGGIADALAAGEILLAARILWLGLKGLWQSGTHELDLMWLRSTSFVGDVFDEVVYGMLHAWNSVAHAFEVAWIETVAFLRSTWIAFVDTVVGAWEWTIAALRKLWIRTKGLFTEVEVEAEIARVDQDFEDAAMERRRRTLGAIGDEERTRSASRGREERRYRAEGEAIASARRDAATERERELVEGVAAAEAERASALAELEAAVGDARVARREAGESDAPSLRSFAGVDPDALEVSAAESAAKASAVATFSSVALSQLAAGGTAAERTAKATEETSRNTKRIAERVGDGRFT